jgi:hypothetical protein
MGLFNFGKKKKASPMDDMMHQMMNRILPKGQLDIEAGKDELLRILKGKVDRSTASDIFVKSISISHIAKEFNLERLRVHLKGYCIQYFTEAEVKQLFDYLTALKAARMFANRTPSEVKGDGNGNYQW